MTDREIFKIGCYSDSKFSVRPIIKKIGSQKARVLFEKSIWSRKCRHCEKEVSEQEFFIWVTYWRAMYSACHKECYKNGYEFEVISCQEIDADCNDCKHFSRISGLFGKCLKFKKAVTANPHNFTGMECFEHRKK